MNQNKSAFHDSAIAPGLYRHYKGSVYRVLGTARHSETEEVLVVYKTQYGDESTWVRPLDMFIEDVTLPDGSLTARFSKIESSEA